MATTRLTLELSPELKALLAKMCQAQDWSYAELLRRAIALMEVGIEAKSRGESMGLFDANGKLTTRIVGI